jgi:hypothetical protein
MKDTRYIQDVPGLKVNTAGFNSTYTWVRFATVTDMSIYSKLNKAENKEVYGVFIENS